MSSPPIERKKPRLCVEPQPSSVSRLLSRRSCTSSAASAFCAAVAAAEPAASSSSRQVFNCVGVTPRLGSHTAMRRTRLRQPGNRLFLVFRRKSPPRLLCHLVPPGRYSIYRLVRDPGATSKRCPPHTPKAVLSPSRISSRTWPVVLRRVAHMIAPHQLVPTVHVDMVLVTVMALAVLLGPPRLDILLAPLCRLVLPACRRLARLYPRVLLAGCCAVWVPPQSRRR